ncbi:hypothetical protein FEDK69T_04950 [Flavobacterium enshiense DK69]|uniref:T9SS type A sorting domain-containing protein n=1 Tax=Flavobacterium enshiense TaxID=1341165 RepID=UPI0003C58737|nr:T9SS type A sorting domain-containing protein [Flavobacterium enshiense]ESU24938.1 hypothetical protein FEDK69T_04950 [Flavobacterium enshiense DK69]
MRKSLLLVVIFLKVIYCYSQPSISWQKSLGGSSADEMYSIQQTTDGGYIIAGRTASNNGDVTGNDGYDDIWIVKLANAGSIQWQKSLGGTDYDHPTSIQQTTDGGYIIAATSNSNDGDVTGNHGKRDYWIVKLTNTGSIEWQKSLGGTEFELACSIQQTTDGGYIVAGYSNSNNGDVTGNHGGSDCWIVKLTNTGSIQWQKSLGGSNDDIANSIKQTTDGGYICAGFTGSIDGDVTGNHGNFDYWIVKLSNTGSIQWQKSLGGTDSEGANSIVQTADGGYIIAGSSGSNNGDVTGNHGGSDCWIVKLTNTGSIQWKRSLGGSEADGASSIQQTTDGGYIIAGYSDSHDGDVTGYLTDYNYWIVKLTSTGSMQWQKSLGGSEQDEAMSAQQTTDGGYIIAGRTASNDFDVTGNHGDYDGWIVKLSNALSTDEQTIGNLFSVYPNPTDNELHVNIKGNTLDLPYIIYDQSGRSVIKGKLNEVNSVIKTGNLSKGVYILSIGNKTKTSMKFIKE